MLVELANEVLRLDQSDPETAQQLWQLSRDAYLVEAELIGASVFPPLRATVADFQNSNSQFFGIADGDELLAAIGLEQNGTAPGFIIASLVVSPGQFRKGLGLRLLDHIVRQKASAQLRVETSIRNVPAIKLYKKLGFQELAARNTEDGYEIISLGLAPQA